MTYIQDFEANEAAGLEGLDADLAAVARTSPERAAAISTAQQADLAVSDEGRRQREAARLSAIEADQSLRTGERGRPPISDERQAYRALAEAHDEAPDIYKVTWARYAGVIESLKTAGPELDALQSQADEQAKLCKEVVAHLEQAADAHAKAVKLADAGRASMARLGDLVAFNSSPFVDMAAGPRELHDLCKRWKLRLSAELARLGIDQEAQLQEQRERRADAAYRAALDKTVAEFRRTGDGKRLWKEYQTVVREYEAARAERPGEDFGGIRDQAQRLLTRFYEQAATHAKLDFDPAAVPQVG